VGRVVNQSRFGGVSQSGSEVAEFGVYCPDTNAFPFALCSVKLASVLVDVAWLKLSKVSAYCLASIAKRFVSRATRKRFAVFCPDESNRDAARIALTVTPENIYSFCLRFLSGLCLKLMALPLSSGVVPIDAEPASEPSDVDVWHSSYSSTATAGMRYSLPSRKCATSPSMHMFLTFCALMPQRLASVSGVYGVVI